MHTPSPEIIPVWPGDVPDSGLWQDAGPELERPSWENSRLVRNVSHPTLTVYLPDPAVANGTGIVVCPGGAFHFLMVDKEGTEIAEWFNARGVAIFVLKYRVFPTPDDDAAFLRIAEDPLPRRLDMDTVWPLSVADGLQAIRTVRAQADRFGIDPNRLGIMGFSAGGAVTAGAATGYDDAASRPSFAAPIYAAAREKAVPDDAPPIFLAHASDDPLVSPMQSIDLYTAWQAAGKRAELHIYAAGGHGFALWPQGLPSDGWIDRLWAWLLAEGFVPVD